MSVPPLLQCRNVAKFYGALAAVDGVDLLIRPGETVGIGGPNGAGKTTFFDLISGLTRVSSGEVLYQGENITGRAPYRLFHDGMARTFQVTSGFGGLTVLQNMLAAVIYGSRGTRAGLLIGRQDRERAMASLDAFGLADIADRLVSDIAVLARKKLMVATAVVHAPKMLLLDEPVGGLLPREVDEFIELTEGLRGRGISIVFIEHVMRFLTAVADRALIMHQGKLIYDGAPRGLAKDPLVRSVYLGSEADNMDMPI
ncbi:MAG: ABC transporter ATP-binding protein [Pseudomonadota bacterium]